jgi:hypothetical protein
VRHDSIRIWSCAHCDRYHQSVFITDRLRPIALTISKPDQVPAQRTLMETLKATVHEIHEPEQHQTPRSSQYSLSINREGSLHDKPTGLGLGYDMERGAGTLESGT